jgi:hypothetical protein
VESTVQKEILGIKSIADALLHAANTVLSGGGHAGVTHGVGISPPTVPTQQQMGSGGHSGGSGAVPRLT